MTIRPGYALPMTLASIIVISLVASIAARQVQTSTTAITTLSERISTQAALISAEQTMIYTLLTEPMTLEGVGVGGASDAASLILGTTSALSNQILPANGEPLLYNEERPVIIRLLDDQSLFNITAANPDTLSEVLSAFGVPEIQHSRFAATLLDYQDTDDIRSLGGAESADYETPGLPPNRPVRDVREVCSILVWRDSVLCQDPSVIMLTSRPRTGDHPTATMASKEVLTIILDSSENAEQAFERLNTGEWRTFAEMGAPQFDSLRDPLSVSGVPGPVLILLSQTPDARQVHRTVLRLTPTGLSAPFEILSKYDMGGPYVQSALAQESLNDVATLPEPSRNTAQPRQ